MGVQPGSGGDFGGGSGSTYVNSSSTSAAPVGGGGDFGGGSGSTAVSTPTAQGPGAGSGSYTVADSAAATAAGSNTGTYFYVQPAFDKRMTTLPFLLGQGQGKVRQGYMIWDKATNVPGYTKKAVVNFLYNPTTIDLQYALDTANVSGGLTFRQAGDDAAAVVNMASTLSFSLLFDRSFELWGSYNPDGSPKTATPGNPANMNDPAQGGVNVDIMAFKQITGQLADQPSGAGNSGTKTGQNYNIQGPMSMCPTWVYLGPPSSGMFYYGYISSWSVSITHWSQAMVPMRCAITVSFQLMPPPWDEPLAGENPGQFWSLQALAPDVPAATAPLPNLPVSAAQTYAQSISAAQGVGGR